MEFVPHLPDWIWGLIILLAGQIFTLWRNSALNRQSLNFFEASLQSLEKRFERNLDAFEKHFAEEIVELNKRLAQQDRHLEKVRSEMVAHQETTAGSIQKVRDIAMRLQGYRDGLRERLAGGRSSDDELET